MRSSLMTLDAKVRPSINGKLLGWTINLWDTVIY